jgi:hypothetical protein
VFTLDQGVSANENEVRAENALGVAVCPGRRLTEAIARDNLETKDRYPRPDQKTDALADRNVQAFDQLKKLHEHH